MKKNPSRKSAADVPADNPEGTMDRFNAGLRRVLAVTKRNKTKRSALVGRRQSRRRP